MAIEIACERLATDTDRDPGLKAAIPVPKHDSGRVDTQFIDDSRARHQFRGKDLTCVVAGNSR